MAQRNKSPFPEFVDILRTAYRIEVKSQQEEPYFSKYGVDGFCSAPEKIICIGDYFRDEEVKDETDQFKLESMKNVLRHEIVHAFLYESGLANNAHSSRCGWARDEEIVDWIARQGCKIFRAWQEANCVPCTMTPENWILMENARQTSP